MSSRRVRAGRAEVEIGIRNKIDAGLRQIQGKMKSFGQNLAVVGGGIAAAGTAITAVFNEMSEKFASVGDDVDKMSARTGVGAKRLTELSFSADRSGTNLETVERGFQGMARLLFATEQGLSSAADTMDGLGLSLDDLKGKSPSEQFDIFAESISQIEDPTNRAALAMRVFGKSGAQLLPMINGGKAGMDALAAEAERLGLTMTQDDATAAALLTDAMGDMSLAIQGLAVQIGIATAGAFTDFFNDIAAGIASVIAWIKENRQLVSTVLTVSTAVVVAGTALTGLGLAAIGISAAIGGIATAIGVVLSPLGALAGIVAAATAGFLIYTETGRAVVQWFNQGFHRLGEIVTSTMGGISDALMANNLQLAAKIGFAGIRLAVGEAMQSVLKIFGSSIASMSQMLAHLAKRLLGFVAELNRVRASVSSTIAKGMGRLIGQKVDDMDSTAIQGAKRFQKFVDDIDVSNLANRIRNVFDPEAVSRELESLKKLAREQRESLAPPEVEIPKVPEIAAVMPEFDKFREAALSGAFSFRGADISRSIAGPKAIAKQQLDEQKKTNNKLDDMMHEMQQQGITFG